MPDTFLYVVGQWHFHTSLNNIFVYRRLFLPLEITAYRLSKDTGIPQTRISQIIKGKRRITADTALRLSSYFGTSAKFWLGLQDDYDIEEERKDKQDLLTKIKIHAPQHTI